MKRKDFTDRCQLLYNNLKSNKNNLFATLKERAEIDPNETYAIYASIFNSPEQQVKKMHLAQI